MKKQFLMVNEADGLIHGASWEEDPDEGPVFPQGQHEPGVVLIKYEPEFTRAGRRDTENPYWNAETQTVEWVETLTLEDIRAAKNEDINRWKLEANSSYFEFQGKQIAYSESDRVEIQAINNVVMLTGAMPTDPDWPAAWKALDNTWLPILDVETWTAFNVAIASRGTAHFKHAQTLKAKLAEATTVEEVASIAW